MQLLSYTFTPSREEVSSYQNSLTPFLYLEMRRKIPIARLAAITVSKDPDSSEMVIHVAGEHDLRLKSSK